jgi:diguanylate cyclase (GGDEF)-like protein/PAS domain S-box-containing protein
MQQAIEASPAGVAGCGQTRVPGNNATLLQEAAALLPIGAWSCDLHTNKLTWTERVFDIFGLPRDASVDRRDALELYTPESREHLEQVRSSAIRAGSEFSLDARIVRLDGEKRWMRITAAPEMRDGKAVRLFGMKQDVTQERREWDRLRALANRDALTGLANRTCFQCGFLDLPIGSNDLANVGALVLFDLDNFKATNDRWGHLAGDFCLTTFARRLSATFPQASMLARIGGDEFAMLLPFGQTREEIRALVIGAIPRLSLPAFQADLTFPMPVSIGMAVAERGARLAPQHLFAVADAALYDAKKGARHRRRRCA